MGRRVKFELKVYCLSQGVSSLGLTAVDLDDATRQAELQGYKVITARKSIDWSLNIGPKKSFSIGLFSQELLALLEAGLSLIETIDILARKSRNVEIKNVLELLARHLNEGLSFSNALETMPSTFSSLYVATIRTSEQTGDLPQALRRYISYYQQLNQIRDKVIAASVYPILLMVVGVLVVFFLMGYVVPRFSHVYEDMGGNLPWLSEMLMRWGKMVSDHAGWMMGGFLLLLGLFIYGSTRPQIRAAITRVIWSIPALGEKLRLYQLARFTRTLAMLIRGGIPFVTALDMVRDLLRQPALLHGAQKAAMEIREGRAVSDAFAGNELTTEVGVRLLAVGERSGDLGQAMERIAKLYDDEIAHWVDWFTRLFEPLLMIIIGLIIGLIVLLMYFPIFELANSIQ